MGKKHNVPVILHADDYGETYNTCTEMIELLEKGYLDGISVITNMRDYERYRELFMKSIPRMHHLPLINIHLNLVEGRHIPQTTDADPTDKKADDHILTWTWSSLFYVSLHLPATDRYHGFMRYQEVYGELKEEIKAQISRGMDFILRAGQIAEEAGIPYTHQGMRIDSHQHAHMIPIVWKALMDVIGEMDIHPDYIRNAHEPLTPFFKHRKCMSFIGMIKNRVLAINASKVQKYISLNCGSVNYLCGVMMSGHMDMVRLSEVLPDVLKVCSRKGYGLEVNIHPAMMLETEVTEEIPYDSAMNFYTSSDRHTEALTVRSFKGIMEMSQDKACSGKGDLP